jgi:glutathione transport system permease protein
MHALATPLLRKGLRSAASVLLTLFFLFVVSRLLIRSIPGDPASAMLEHFDSNLSLEWIRDEFHLDLPWYQSLYLDLKKFILHGDLGQSLHSRKPVLDEVVPRLLNTLKLSAIALGIGLTSGLAIAITWTKRIPVIWRIAPLFTALMASLPTPWTGPLLAWALGVKLNWFEPSGNIILPALTLALSLTAFWTRIIHARLEEALHLGENSHAVRASRGRGIPEWKVILKYSFLPTAPALLAILGTQVGNLVAGSFVIEVLFDWPGLGSLFVDSVLRRDYSMVEACVLISGTTAVLGTRLGDIFQTLMDPRNRDADELPDGWRKSS